ncbi:MAG TPA: PLP-dependent aminotransferase family protein [Polyangia bacterium]|nr:PLP-dependent aminotransferase family protein [Polyangia bacterium]
MPTWDLHVAIDHRAELPLFLQIARALADDVRRGRLKPGDALPGSRRLAETLAVHRNTVLAAYEELAAEGWIRREPARGTFVSRELPDARPRQFAAPAGGVEARPGYELRPGPEPYAPGVIRPGILPLYGGVPDRRLAPALALGRAYRRALAGKHGRALLDYGDPRGHARLRVALGAMLAATRGVHAPDGALVVTRGSQQGLDLIARALIAPGDVVAVEALGYRPAWEALRSAGARLVPIPVDEDGLRLDALAELAARAPLRAVYVTPHHQYPTTATLTAGRRLQLLELARARRFAILEDDYDHEFHFVGRPILPLASADPSGVVVYLGTLSKILAPGLRIGYLVAPPPVVERIVAHRAYADRQGDLAVEHAVAELLEDGEVARHARRVKRIYSARRELLAERLRAELGGALTFSLPLGGIALWARVAPDLDVDAWAERALARGVELHPARRFAFDGRSRPFLRLGFAALDDRELRDAVRRLAQALR